MNPVTIIDTTLRDGEQAAGIAFTPDEKIIVARLLDQVGVSFIEAGVPAMGEDEQRVISQIIGMGLKAGIITWNRLCLDDIRASVRCGARFVHISAPVSDIHIRHKLRKDRKWVLYNTRKAVWYAREKGCEVSVGAEDASRADFKFLARFASVIREEGVTRLRYADTVGVLEPFAACKQVGRLKEESGIDIEIHAHNDFGMATANTLAAVRGGARFVSTTVNGIGERAGNAPMEEVVLAMEKLFKWDAGLNWAVMPLLSRYVARAANRRNLSYSIL